eukprot:5377566-Prymnesium_polylepis.2
MAAGRELFYLPLRGAERICGRNCRVKKSAPRPGVWDHTCTKFKPVAGRIDTPDGQLRGYEVDLRFRYLRPRPTDPTL